ncbi:MAG: YihA family ribosome biogenesis GTP-binding protein, partial [Lachnospiraceae bacterium]|nr:YihA family ribosome biogenesis GTP-binding protein [Lachnospiraceae bacterium]
VDLPGYGYTKIGVEVRAKWGKMVENYLHRSKQLKAIFLLIDIRHEPSANDCQMYEWILSQGYHPVIIATKLDKIKRSQVQKHLNMIRTGIGADAQTLVFPFSALNKQGRDEINAYIEGLSQQEENAHE